MTKTITKTDKPNRKLPILERGQALVIYGPQGSGKTTLAKKIAEGYGGFRCVEVHQILSKLDFASILDANPKVLIVDTLHLFEFYIDCATADYFKTIISEKTISLRKLYQSDFRDFKLPHFIFCTQTWNTSQDEIYRDWRRIRVINMEETTG